MIQKFFQSVIGLRKNICDDVSWPGCAVYWFSRSEISSCWWGEFGPSWDFFFICFCCALIWFVEQKQQATHALFSRIPLDRTTLTVIHFKGFELCCVTPLFLFPAGATCVQSVGLTILDLEWIWEFHSSSFSSSYQRETSNCVHQRVLVCTWIVHSFPWARQHCALASTAAGKTMRCPLLPWQWALGLTSNDLSSHGPHDVCDDWELIDNREFSHI